MNNFKYQFICRPGYGSSDLLIEISSLKDQNEIYNSIITALESIEPNVCKYEDCWQNEELIYIFDSTNGKFTLHIDNFGIAFILAVNNNELILKIDSILNQNILFEKKIVDFSKYKLP